MKVEALEQSRVEALASGQRDARHTSDGEADDQWSRLYRRRFTDTVP